MFKKLFGRKPVPTTALTPPAQYMWMFRRSQADAANTYQRRCRIGAIKPKGSLAERDLY